MLGRLSDVTYVVDCGQETSKARQEQEQKSGLGFIRVYKGDGNTEEKGS